eukprot:TRINITY_DN6420_c0_g1_i1.p1 TRINITY_DN6420_c0_g1~~TRINITY_DN6420_c0_g1_i1.p1  ORF type:complete len:420 (-),score=66.54 TRINITY_DN6420_c0_g1_i1:125-1384(-)
MEMKASRATSEQMETQNRESNNRMGTCLPGQRKVLHLKYPTAKQNINRLCLPRTANLRRLQKPKEKKKNQLIIPSITPLGEFNLRQQQYPEDDNGSSIISNPLALGQFSDRDSKGFKLKQSYYRYRNMSPRKDHSDNKNSFEEEKGSLARHSNIGVSSDYIEFDANQSIQAKGHAIPPQLVISSCLKKPMLEKLKEASTKEQNRAGTAAGFQKARNLTPAKEQYKRRRPRSQEEITNKHQDSAEKKPNLRMSSDYYKNNYSTNALREKHASLLHFPLCKILSSNKLNDAHKIKKDEQEEVQLVLKDNTFIKCYTSRAKPMSENIKVSEKSMKLWSAERETHPRTKKNLEMLARYNFKLQTISRIENTAVPNIGFDRSGRYMDFSPINSQLEMRTSKRSQISSKYKAISRVMSIGKMKLP